MNFWYQYEATSQNIQKSNSNKSVKQCSFIFPSTLKICILGGDIFASHVWSIVLLGVPKV